MNYRHAFHAGNFADVFKHAILCLILSHLQKKAAPFCVLDTHAGIGLYDLRCDAAEKTGEYRHGAARIWDLPQCPDTLAPYVALLRAANKTEDLRFYPGSPWIAQRFLRPQDRLVLNELHPQDCGTLKRQFRNEKRVQIHCKDAYEAMASLLPPKERRGLVLIDPPYESADEWKNLESALHKAFRHFAHGIYAVWYPLKERKAVEKFLSSLRAALQQDMLRAELTVDARSEILGGTGMVIVNPPWQLDTALRTMLPFLADNLKINDTAHWQLTTL